MRVLLDTNVLVSYLLPTSFRKRTVARIVDAAFDQVFALLVPEQAIEELQHTIASKPYFIERITAREVDAFIEAIRSVAEILPHVTEPAPRIVRDPDDDFILVHAILGNADYLVTGDKDLLALGDSVAPLVILSAADFVTGVLDRRR